MSLRDRLSDAAHAIVLAGRFVRQLPRRAWRWLADNASRALAVTWLAGMVTFGVGTVRRARALDRAEDAAAAARPTLASRPARAQAPEVVEMLDVDEINQRRIDRFHALGLAAPGESEDPDDETIAAARAKTSTSRAPEGEIAGKAGDVVVVTKGGIKGWLQRNKGKKADPETLAWLRAQEAEEGGPAYAGWADREDGDILAWAKDRKRDGTTEVADNSHADIAAALDGIAPPARPGPAGSADQVAAGATTGAAPSGDEDARAPTSGSDTTPPAPPPGPGARAPAAEAAVTAPTPASGSAGEPAAATSSTRAMAAGATVPPTTVPPTAGQAPAPAAPPRTARVPLGFRVDRLGAAAVRALEHARTATAPTADELAPIAALIQRSGNALAAVARSQSAVVLLRGDLMFKAGVLTADGRRLARDLAKALAAMRDRGFRLVADPERAMELASTLVIAGLPADRVEIALTTQLDPALDLLELEITSAPTGVVVAPEAPR